MIGTTDALVIDGGVVRLDNIPLVVPRGYVLVKTLWARWAGVDEAVRRGLIPVSRSVAGYTGVGVVVDVGVDADASLSGKAVSLVRVSEKFMPPVKGHGFLARYAAAPSDQLVTVPRSEHSVLLLDGSLACETISAIEGGEPHNVLVMGMGTYGILVAYLLHDEGIEYSIVVSNDSDAYILARELGLSTAQAITRADAVVGATLDTFLVEKALRESGASLLVMHPLMAYRGVRVSPLGRRISIIGVSGRRSLAGCAERVAKKLWKKLSEHMSYVDELVAPPEKGLPLLGVVYRLSS